MSLMVYTAAGQQLRFHQQLGQQQLFWSSTEAVALYSAHSTPVQLMKTDLF